MQAHSLNLCQKKNKLMSNPIGIILGYFAGKIFGWFYVFYILAIVGGLFVGNDGVSLDFLPGLFLFLSFAILPFVVFAIISLIIKKIKSGPDNLSLEFKIIFSPLIFFLCFIFFAIFSPNTVLGTLFFTIIKEFFIIIVIGLIVLYFGIISLVKFFKLKPKNKNLISYFVNEVSFLRKVLILGSLFIIFYVILTIFNIVINWDEIVNLLR